MSCSFFINMIFTVTLEQDSIFFHCFPKKKMKKKTGIKNTPKQALWFIDYLLSSEMASS